MKVDQISRDCAERERELVRHALFLQGKKPEETLKMMFELVEFAVKLNTVANQT